MSDMIERVARALARVAVERGLRQVLAAHQVPGEPSEGQIARDVEKAWPYHVEEARAAISAVREPSDDVAEVMGAHAANGMVDWRDIVEAYFDAVIAPQQKPDFTIESEDARKGLRS